MRFLLPAVAALCAAVVSAQNNAIAVPAGQSTLDVTAGTDLTIQWTDPSSSTVTIKLQQDPITPDGGLVLAAGVPASDGTATLTIPSGSDLNAHVYTIEIIDDTDASNINFSPNFGIQGATGTALLNPSTASITGSVSSTAGSSTATDSTEITTTTMSGSTSSSASITSSASTSGSQSSSPTSSSSVASETTAAPNSNSNGASGLKVQGGLLAMAVGMIVAL